MDMGERVSPFLATLPTTFGFTRQRRVVIKAGGARCRRAVFVFETPLVPCRAFLFPSELPVFQV
jgi:hypothetical protein